MYRWFLLLTAVMFLLPGGAFAQREKLPPRDLIIVEQKYPQAQRTGTGLWTEVLREGTGIYPQRGDTVAVLYVGALLDGTEFDRTEDPSDPFTFQLARGKVIHGWEYGMLMMREGEKRRLIVPYELGYGTRGRSPDIPRMATLVFEVEMIKVTPQSESAP